MKKMQIIGLTLALLLVFTFGAAADMLESRHSRMDTDLFYQYDGKINDYTTPESLLIDVDMYVDLITAELKVELTEKITVVITEDPGKEFSNRRDDRKMLFIKAEEFQYGMVPLCHEITHLIVPSIYGVLYEGLAEYLSAKYEKNPVVASLYYELPHVRASYECMFLRDEVTEVFANTKWIEDMETHKQRSYKRIGYSFVLYLIEEYGMESFMKLYMSKNPDGYKAAYGKDREEIYAEWKEFVGEQVKLESEARRRIIEKEVSKP